MQTPNTNPERPHWSRKELSFAAVGVTAIVAPSLFFSGAVDLRSDYEKCVSGLGQRHCDSMAVLKETEHSMSRILCDLKQSKGEACD